MKFFHEKITGWIRSLELYYHDGEPWVRVTWEIGADPPLWQNVVRVPLKEDVKVMKEEILKRIGTAYLEFKEKDVETFEKLSKSMGLQFEIDLTKLKEELKRQRGEG